MNPRYYAKIYIKIFKILIENRMETTQKFNNYSNISSSSNNNLETKSSENSPRPLMVSNKLTSKTSKGSSTPTSSNSYNFPREYAEYSHLTNSPISQISVNFINRLILELY